MSDVQTKTFDAVQLVRTVRDELSAVIGEMSVDEENRWLRSVELADPTLKRLMAMAGRPEGTRAKQRPPEHGR